MFAGIVFVVYFDYFKPRKIKNKYTKPNSTQQAEQDLDKIYQSAKESVDKAHGGKELDKEDVEALVKVFDTFTLKEYSLNKEPRTKINKLLKTNETVDQSENNNNFKR